MLRTKSLSFLLTIAALAVAVPTFAPRAALADEAPVAHEAAPRVNTVGRFQRYVLAPGGRPMGLMLADGRFVPTPRHAMHHDAPGLTAGDVLQIESVVRTTPTGVVLARAVVQKDGAVIADATKVHRHHHDHQGAGTEQHARREHRHVALTPVAASGKIAAVISGPHGHVRAVVLEDGTTAVAHHMETLGLKVGDKVALAGKGGVYPTGRALRIEKITLPSGEIRDIPPRVRRAPAENPV